MRLNNRLGLAVYVLGKFQERVGMTAEADTPEEPPKKSSKLPMIIGLALALVGGGGGFFAVQSGILFGSDEPKEEEEVKKEDMADVPAVSFVALDPVVISLPASGGRDHLRFSAQLEVLPEYLGDVEALKPRIVDVLNSYLRAVELSELEDPTSLMRLRSQMLRRIQVVTGEGRVKDLLIMEFVLS